MRSGQQATNSVFVWLRKVARHAADMPKNGIDILSDDVLHHVFDALQPLKLVAALAVSHVSRRWRSTALDHSALWATIALEGDPQRFLKFLPILIDRSKAAPLEVDLDLTRLNRRPSNGEDWAGAMKRLRQQAHRILSLTLVFRNDDMFSQDVLFVGGLHFPIMTDLRIEAYGGIYHKVDISAPKLRQVFVRDLKVKDWSRILGPSVRIFMWKDGRNHCAVDTPRVVFASCPNLEEVVIKVYFTPELPVVTTACHKWLVAPTARLRLKLVSVENSIGFLSHLPLAALQHVDVNLTPGIGIAYLGGPDDCASVLSAMLHEFGAITDIAILDMVEITATNARGHTRVIRGRLHRPRYFAALMATLLGAHGAAHTLRQLRLAHRRSWCYTAEVTRAHPIASPGVEISLQNAMDFNAFDEPADSQFLCPGLGRLRLCITDVDGRREFTREDVDAYTRDLGAGGCSFPGLCIDQVTLSYNGEKMDECAVVKHYGEAGWVVIVM